MKFENMSYSTPGNAIIPIRRNQTMAWTETHKDNPANQHLLSDLCSRVTVGPMRNDIHHASCVCVFSMLPNSKRTRTRPQKLRLEGHGQHLDIDPTADFGVLEPLRRTPLLSRLVNIFCPDIRSEIDVLKDG